MGMSLKFIILYIIGFVFCVQGTSFSLAAGHSDSQEKSGTNGRFADDKTGRKAFPTLQEIQRLIEELGNDNYRKRYQADRELKSLVRNFPFHVTPSLVSALKHRDLEVARRARVILENGPLVGGKLRPSHCVTPVGSWAGLTWSKDRKAIWSEEAEEIVERDPVTLKINRTIVKKEEVGRGDVLMVSGHYGLVLKEAYDGSAKQVRVIDLLTNEDRVLKNIPVLPRHYAGWSRPEILRKLSPLVPGLVIEEKKETFDSLKGKLETKYDKKVGTKTTQDGHIPLTLASEGQFLFSVARELEYLAPPEIIIHRVSDGVEMGRLTMPEDRWFGVQSVLISDDLTSLIVYADHNICRFDLDGLSHAPP